jgi:hypothetical protein
MRTMKGNKAAKQVSAATGAALVHPGDWVGYGQPLSRTEDDANANPTQGRSGWKEGSSTSWRYSMCSPASRCTHSMLIDTMPG